MALTIFCDESGFTGPNLFLDEQRFFVYASMSMTHKLAAEVVAKMRTNFRIGTDELKYENLSKKPRGVSAVRWLLTTYGHNAAVFYADKRYAAAGKFFEYTFEPVLRPLRALFYGVGFHRFVSNLLFSAWEEGEQVAHELLEDGQNLIRHKNPAALKRLLREPIRLSGDDDPLTAIASFCATYRREILREIAAINADEVTSRWSMDISDTSLLMLLEHWGRNGDELEVYCDESKPLQQSAEHLSILATTNLSALLGFTVPTSRGPLRLAKPIEFVESKGKFIGIQLADVVAGAVRSMLLKPGEPTSAEWRSLLMTRMVRRCVFGQSELLDLHRPEAVVNMYILSELGRRSRERLDPLAYMPQFVAEIQAQAPAIAAEDDE